MLKKIAYEGVSGSYSHTTATLYFGEKNSFIGVHPFSKIFKLVDSGNADYGVVPIENTLAGSIYKNYDLLFQNDIHVIGEYKLKIEHNLLTIPNTNFSDIKKVYSHPKALEQCDIFFDSNPQVEEIVWHDTAGAAKFIAEKSDKSVAAIAGKEAANLYGLSILKQNIQDDKNNWTRFFIVSKTADFSFDADKASLIFSVKHEPGSLFRAIKTFADLKLNMTKLESRSIPGKSFEYLFYVDFEFDNNHIEEVKRLMKELKSNTHYLKMLGYYKRFL